MSLNDRIRESRIKKGYTQEYLGKLIGVAKTTVAGYEKNREPSAAIIGEIADALSIDVGFLFQDEVKIYYDNHADPAEMENIIKKYRTLDEHGKRIVDLILTEEAARVKKENQAPPTEVPALGEIITLMHFTSKVSAGRGVDLANIHVTDSFRVVSNAYTRKSDFCLTVDGNSMEPRFYDGDIILVQEAEDLDFGEIGVFIINDRGFVKQKGEHHLISLNPSFSSIYLGPYDDFRCVGRVIGTLDPDWLIGME